MTPYVAIAAAWHSKCVEPEKRNKDGLRWIIHRFPIKGGISMRDTMLRDAGGMVLSLNAFRGIRLRVHHSEQCE